MKKVSCCLKYHSFYFQIFSENFFKHDISNMMNGFGSDLLGGQASVLEGWRSRALGAMPKNMLRSHFSLFLGLLSQCKPSSWAKPSTLYTI